MLLTDAKIRGAREKGKTYRLKDGDGLYLIIRQNGKKFWQLRYRYLGKEKSLSFGRYPQVMLAEARDKKINALRMLDEGVDPSSNRKIERRQAIYRDRNSFGVVAEEWIKRNSDIWTTRHQNACRSRLNNHILPRLGARPIAEITPLELLSVIQEIEASNATYMSHRCLQFCSAVYDFAIITGRATHNITTGLSKALKPHREQHYPTLSARELPLFLQALERLETHEQNRLAFKFLLLTAVRTGEMRFSRWRDFDLERGEWIIPAEMTKMRTVHIVPLSQQMLALLEQLEEISGSNEWLFPNLKGQRHPVMSENTINQMITRMGYRGRIVGHGFRSLFSTVLNENGFNRDAIERQLSHMERNSIRAAYNRAEYLEERRGLMQWWADFIEGRKKAENVHHFRSTVPPDQYRARTNTHRAIQAYQVGVETGEENVLH